jgi:hypothetical protein
VIGKGYGDKGTAKNEAVDGSPSWQEVASTASSLERRREELNEQLHKESDPGLRNLQRKEDERLERFYNRLLHPYG